MQLLSSISLPFRKIRVRLTRTPRQAIRLLKRIVLNGAGPWALADILWRAAFISLQYDRWRKQHELTTEDATELRNLLAELPYQPLISIVMPVYNTDERWLRRAIESVRQQVYPHWELCIADDASSEPHVARTLEQYQQAEPRIKLVRRQTQGHIAVASNSALELATGDYVALLDHDDEITADALLEVVRMLNKHPEADFVYSDEDKLDTTGHRTEPFFKPDWSPLLLFNVNYITHFAVLRRQLVMDVGGFRHDYVGSQDHDLFLRITARTNRVFHIPKVLYSWRKAATSAALSADIKGYAQNASFRAVQDAVAGRDRNATVTPGSYAPFVRVRYPVTGDPHVSLVVLVRSDQELAAARSILARTDGRRCELIAVTNQAHLASDQSSETLRPIVCPDESSRAMLQAGAQAATGDYLLFAERPFTPVDADWLNALLEYAQLPNVGCVGAKIISRRHAIVTAGMALGINGSAGSIGAGIADVPQLMFYLNLKDAIREVSAVSAACMMVKTSTFWHLNGFDEQLGNALHDVDFCLRTGERSLSTVFMPYARVYAGRGYREAIPSEEEKSLFTRRWADRIAHDPYYSIHLTRVRQDMRMRTREVREYDL